MSSLFAQINQLNQEAQKQREIVERGSIVAASVPQSTSGDLPSVSPDLLPENDPRTGKTDTGALSGKSADAATHVTSVSDVATSQGDVTLEKSSGHASKRRHLERGREESGLGKGSRIDLDKLRTVIEEIAAVKTNAYGFSVRMSEREQADIEEFILDTLRKEGIKGYEVSIAKLMRYAMRYMFRVHPQEFVTALRAALQVEGSLSI